MTTSLLSFGCALLAFSPSLSLLFLVTYHKAHLIIVVTTSAFAYLISSLASSILWVGIPQSLRTNVWLLVIPGVVCQMLARAGFVHVYHRVEGAIRASVRAHERRSARPPTGGVQQQQSESAQLRLELNDASCGLAAGTGYALMHGLMLYGTLLASESGTLGTLYQPSCSAVPSLVNSAINCFLFGILDVVLMLGTFYGMRRRRCHDRKVGNATLLSCGLTHATAGLITGINAYDDGCRVALPLLGAVVMAAVLTFYVAIGRGGRYLPESQKVGGGAAAPPPGLVDEEGSTTENGILMRSSSSAGSGSAVHHRRPTGGESGYHED